MWMDIEVGEVVTVPGTLGGAHKGTRPQAPAQVAAGLRNSAAGEYTARRGVKWGSNVTGGSTVRSSALPGAPRGKQHQQQHHGGKRHYEGQQAPATAEPGYSVVGRRDSENMQAVHEEGHV